MMVIPKKPQSLNLDNTPKNQRKTFYRIVKFNSQQRTQAAATLPQQKIQGLKLKPWNTPILWKIYTRY